jgi:predicted  nucleic acid-binding Zn-ribbon protein
LTELKAGIDTTVEQLTSKLTSIEDELKEAKTALEGVNTDTLSEQVSSNEAKLIELESKLTPELLEAIEASKTTVKTLTEQL